MEQAQGSGVALAVTGLYLSFCLSLILYLSTGTKGTGGGPPPSSRLARRRRGLLRSCHTLIRVNTV